MKDKSLKIAGLLIVFSGAIAIYLKHKKNSSENDIDIIINSGASSNRAGLQTFQSDFIKAWAIAVKANSPIFTFQGKAYNTTGGKAVKNQ
jgi:hypothetical protein